ncbi:MAG: NAD-dependent isocitrate dehydrogenase [Clostridia bacterium]|nr:NAD-dependent isocitrate dehydrogenase [Clostridia bacterium]
MNNITVIPGDGIGPEIMDATLNVLNAFGLDLNFEMHLAGQQALNKGLSLIPDILLSNIKCNQKVLKGPLMTPIGEGFSSVNVALRKAFDLYINFRPIQSIDGKIDLIIFRENTEGLYIGKELEINEDEYHSIKVITRKNSERIIKAAFSYAEQHNRKKVTLVHKANILKKTDGLFLKIGNEISKLYPNITYETLIIDNMCMQMVMNPTQFDVIVTMNLYGDILSDLGAGLVGGLGVVPGVNKNNHISIYEAVHGTAPDLAGKNLANPISLLLTSCFMLEDLHYTNEASILRRLIYTSMLEKKTTHDLGGHFSTSEYATYLVQKIKEV